MTKAIETWVKRNEEKFQNDTEKSHLIDFLMSEYSHKNSINFTYETCLKKSVTWQEALHAKALLLKNSGKTKVIHTFPDGYQILQLLDHDATMWEGNQMGHCVGSDQYKPGTIYSIRDQKGMPHATIEIQRSTGGRADTEESYFVSQLRGKENDSLHHKYVPYFLEFCTVLNTSTPRNVAYDLHKEYQTLNEDEFNFLTSLFEVPNYGKITDSSAAHFVIHKKFLKEKIGAPYITIRSRPDLRAANLFTLIDGDTAPNFFINLTASQIETCLKEAIRFSSSGLDHLFSLNPETALRIYKQFSSDYCVRQGVGLTTLYKNGLRSDVVEFVKNINMKRTSISLKENLIDLMKEKDQEINELILFKLDSIDIKNKEEESQSSRNEHSSELRFIYQIMFAMEKTSWFKESLNPYIEKKGLLKDYKEIIKKIEKEKESQ